MNKLLTASISTLIVGLLLLAYAGYLGFSSNLVVSKTFDKPASEISLDPINVNTANLVQIKASAKVISKHILQVDEGTDGIKKEALARIPLEVTILNENNQKIYSKSGTLDDFNSGFSKAELYEDKIKVNQSVNFGKFKSNAEILKATIKINPDTEYGATIQTLTIKVYDSVKAISSFVKLGLLFAFLGFFVAMFAWTKSADRNYFTMAIILSVIFGGIALDRFYLGYFWLGLLKMMTFGGCGIWYVVDLILIATKGMKNSNGQELK